MSAGTLTSLAAKAAFDALSGGLVVVYHGYGGRVGMLRCSRKILSLLEMKNLYLDRFIAISNRLTECTEIARREKGTLDSEDRQSLSKSLTKVGEDCKDANFRCTLMQIERIQNLLSDKYVGDPVEHSEVSVLFDDLLRRLTDEAKLSLCLIMSPDEAEFYTGSQHFGAEVAERFSPATSDIEDAAKCLACGRGTATVFHLMRVMEEGLKSVARALGIPYAPSWESYLDQIAKRIDVKYKKKGIAWKRDEPFFREVAAHLRAVKVAWRNPTMHIVNNYSPEMAEEVFNSVKGFMRHLATKLKTTSSGSAV